jgi:hypothetical protein
MGILDSLLGSKKNDWHAQGKWRKGLSPAALRTFDALAARYSLVPAAETGVFRDRFDEFQLAVTAAWSRMKAPGLLTGASAPPAFELRLGPPAESYRMEFWVPPPGREVTGVPSIDDPAWRGTFQGDDWEGLRIGRFVLTPDVAATAEVADALPELAGLVRGFSEAVVELMYWHPGLSATMLADAVTTGAFAKDLDLARGFVERANKITFDAQEDAPARRV